MLAMLGVGIWALQSGGRAIGLGPAVFITAMTAGGILGLRGPALPLLEAGVALSVLFVGLLIITEGRMPQRAALATIAAAAVFHGYAHGSELPASASPLFYSAGFVVATTGIHLAGTAAATALRRAAGLLPLHALGAALAGSGIVLVFF